MRADLANFAPMQNDDFIRILNSGQSMRNHNRGAIRH